MIKIHDTFGMKETFDVFAAVVIIVLRKREDDDIDTDMDAE